MYPVEADSVALNFGVQVVHRRKKLLEREIIVGYIMQEKEDFF